MSHISWDQAYDDLCSELGREPTAEHVQRRMNMAHTIDEKTQTYKEQIEKSRRECKRLRKTRTLSPWWARIRDHELGWLDLS